ncbi:MAG: hypothetical protein DMG06_21305 [Acidobacteria bacterium]|nr:MAG: hypothetical protein DMG06_21305 [Acidobacteriota bacterium]
MRSSLDQFELDSNFLLPTPEVIILIIGRKSRKRYQIKWEGRERYEKKLSLTTTPQDFNSWRNLLSQGCCILPAFYRIEKARC